MPGRRPILQLERSRFVVQLTLQPSVDDVGARIAGEPGDGFARRRHLMQADLVGRERLEVVLLAGLGQDLAILGDGFGRIPGHGRRCRAPHGLDIGKGLRLHVPRPEPAGELCGSDRFDHP